MIYFKSCPKCHGDLTTGRDAYGGFISCLQCGFLRDIEAKAGASTVTHATAKPPIWFAEEEPLAKAA